MRVEDRSALPENEEILAGLLLQLGDFVLSFRGQCPAGEVSPSELLGSGPHPSGSEASAFDMLMFVIS